MILWVTAQCPYHVCNDDAPPPVAQSKQPDLWSNYHQREAARRRSDSLGGATPATRLRFAVAALAAALPPDGKRRLLALARDYVAAAGLAPDAMAAALQALVDEFDVRVPLPRRAGGGAGT